MKLKPCSTVGILTTLATLGGGITLSWRYAKLISALCLNESQQLTKFLDSEVSIPGFNFSVTATTPDKSFPIPMPFSAKSYNLTIPSYQFEIPIATPKTTINISDLVDDQIAKVIDDLPKVFQSICEIGSMQTGIAYTIIIAGFLCLLTFASHINSVLKDRVSALEKNAKNQIPLHQHSATHFARKSKSGSRSIRGSARKNMAP